MGTRHHFQCGGCGYAAQVSGGNDCGMVASTTTILCETCRCLYDVTTGRRDEASGEFTEHAARCPKSARHTIKQWQSGDPCPNCGNPLAKGEVACLWD